MFEHNKHFAGARDLRHHDEGTSRPTGASDAASKGGGRTLRDLDWRELTARLNAARDLRRVLADERGGTGLNATEFALAASRYLDARAEPEAGRGASETAESQAVEERAESDRRQRGVNPVSLETGKASASKIRRRGGTFGHGAHRPGQPARARARDDQ